MTTISNSDSYYLTRSRMRDLTIDAVFASPGAVPAQPVASNQPPSVGSDDISGASSASLASALWDMDSSQAVRTTLSGEAAEPSSTDRLLVELQEWSRMTPAEMIRAQALEQMGISEDELAALPADERKIIEDKIADAIKKSLAPDNQVAANDDDKQRTTFIL